MRPENNSNGEAVGRLCRVGPIVWENPHISMWSECGADTHASADRILSDRVYVVETSKLGLTTAVD